MRPDDRRDVAALQASWFHGYTLRQLDRRIRELQANELPSEKRAATA